MAKTVQQILGINTMLKMVETPFAGVASDPIPTGFFTLREDCIGETARWLQVENTRNVAPNNLPGAPARNVGKVGLTQREATCLTPFNEQNHNAHVWQNLTSMDTMQQDLGASYIDYQVREFNRLHDNLRISAVCSALFLNHIYMNSNGDLLHSSSGNAIDVDFRVPATNAGALSTLTALPSTASWATDGTDILGQLDGIRKLAQQYSGRPIRYALYGSSILNHISTNTAVVNTLGSNPQLATALANNIIPANFGFGGGDSRTNGPRVDWINASTLGFKDASGTFRYWCGANQVIFLPEPDLGWYCMQEGTHMVPNSLTLPSNPGPELFRQVRGRFTYCEIKTNPSGITHYMGDTFLPLIKDPNAVFNITDVTA